MKHCTVTSFPSGQSSRHSHPHHHHSHVTESHHDSRTLLLASLRLAPFQVARPKSQRASSTHPQYTRTPGAATGADGSWWGLGADTLLELHCRHTRCKRPVIAERHIAIRTISITQPVFPRPQGFRPHLSPPPGPSTRLPPWQDPRSTVKMRKTIYFSASEYSKFSTARINADAQKSLGSAAHSPLPVMPRSPSITVCCQRRVIQAQKATHR